MKSDNGSDIMLLTGAGASVKIGIPTMQGMVKKYREQSNLPSQIAQALELLDQIKIAKDLEMMLLVNQELINFLDAPSYKILEKSDMMVKSSSISEIRGQYKRIRTSQRALRSHIQSWIATTCLRFNRPDAQLIWGKLCKILAAKQIPLYTTNYDHSVEVVAQSEGVKVADNFRRLSSGKIYWDDSLKSFDSEGLKLVKLHGSVNWYIPKEEGRIEKIDANVFENGEGVPVDRLAIYPTRFKDIYDTHFFSLYKQFLNSLDHSSLLIVIGHSLRDEYVRAAIRESFRKPDFHLIYIGPNLPELPDFPKLRGALTPKIQHVPAYFENFISELGYLLELQDASTIFEECSRIVKFSHRKSSIKFDRRLTWLNRGKRERRSVDVTAYAFPPLKMKATLRFPKIKDSPAYNLEVIDESTGQQPVIAGAFNSSVKVKFEIPKESPIGKGELVFELISEEGVQTYESVYVSNIRE